MSVQPCQKCGKSGQQRRTIHGVRILCQTCGKGLPIIANWEPPNQTAHDIRTCQTCDKGHFCNFGIADNRIKPDVANWESDNKKAEPIIVKSPWNYWYH